VNTPKAATNPPSVAALTPGSLIPVAVLVDSRATVACALYSPSTKSVPPVGIAAGRVLRRWYRAKRLTKQITVQRVDRATGHVRYRRCRKRKQEVAWWPCTVGRRAEVWFALPFRCRLLDQLAWLKFGRAGHSEVLLDEVFE
jgi:hypothetical protein